MDSIEGHWYCVSSTFSGISTLKKIVDAFTLEIIDNEFRMIRDNILLFEGIYRLHENAVLKKIDIVPAVRKDGLLATLGLYEIDGDTLTLCLAVGGQERPTTLSSEFGSWVDLKIWKRKNT